MNVRVLTACMAIIVVWSTAGAAPTPAGGGWWDDTPWQNPERGFNWYPPDAPPKKSAKKSEEKPRDIKDMKTMPELQAELARLKDLAVMQPTRDNVRNYLEAQTYVMDKSALFADVARRVVWATPSVDYNNRSPTATFAQLARKDQRSDDQARTLAELSRDYGLMFFFRSDCPYCHQQAPVLKLLEQQYGMPVLGVSLDGGVLPQFPDARRDNGVSMIVSQGQGITAVPALFLVHRASRQAVPVGTGALAIDEIVERIRVLTRTQPGQEF
ncbi:conjugal transfer protein TraF [Betaproteobacteria bacterium SCN1]|nr:conjugal transfer protein TraF [Betaproteobacteria bacterium SCN1]